MVTAVVCPSSPTKPEIGLPGRRYDHLFFSAMALLMLGTVFVGFAHTYYLAGVFHAPLPSLIIHLHGAAFSCWILLLVTQTSLVSAGRVDIHRRLGVASFLLACLMIILGVLAATDSLARRAVIRNFSTSFPLQTCWFLGRSFFSLSAPAPIPQRISASSSSPRPRC